MTYSPPITGDNTENDTFLPLLGIDVVDGGDGEDILEINYSSNTFAGGNGYNAGIVTGFNDDGSGSFSGNLYAYKNSDGGYDQVSFSNVERFRITGTNFNDNIIIGWNNDTVNAGSGDDYIDAVEGIDSIDGGTGIDTIRYVNLGDATNNFTINSSGATITANNGIVIKNVEQFTNLYTGSGNDNIAFTGRFNNSESWGGGINTGYGNDTINAGLGEDLVDGGKGTDTLTIDYSSNTYAGTTDYPEAIDSDYNPNNSGGYDGWVSAYYNNTGNYDRVEFYKIEKLSIIGTGKTDYFKYGGGTISIDGGAGIDIIGKLDLTNETVNLTVNNSGGIITQANGTVIKNVEQFENIYTGNGNDTIAFTGRFNTNQWWWSDYGISTGNGNDTINPGLGQDEVNGGFGTDTLVIDYSSNTFNGGGGYGAGIVSFLSHEGGGTWGGRLYAYYNSSGAYDEVYFTQIERFNVKGTSGGDVLYGGSGADTLIGNNGNDLIESGGGNDILDGGSGTDILRGGKGNDTYINPTGDVITELVSEGIDTVESNATFTLNTTALINVENLTLTGTAVINGTGNALKNYLFGNSVGNSLSGLDNHDTLNGGAGVDTLIGGKGNDTYIVDSTTDTITELTGVTEGTTDAVISSVNFSLASIANVENLIISGITGRSATGNNSDNKIQGGDGNDTLNGSGGVDTLIGGKGNDIYIVDTTTDTITELAGEGTIDTVQSTADNFSLENIDNVERLTLIGSSSINGTGNSLANLITGNSANNVLTGGIGNDTLTGNNGNDRLVGGEDTDILNLGLNDGVTDTVIYSAGDGSDTVNQFVLGTDKFAFLGLIGVDIITVGSNTQFRLGNGIQGDTGFGTGSLLFTITGVNTFTEGNIASSVDASNQATLLFS